MISKKGVRSNTVKEIIRELSESDDEQVWDRSFRFMMTSCLCKFGCSMHFFFFGPISGITSSWNLLQTCWILTWKRNLEDSFDFEGSGVVDANMFERIHLTVDSSFWQWSPLLFHRGSSQFLVLGTRNFDLGVKSAQSEDHTMVSYRYFHCGETDRMFKLKVQIGDQKFRKVWSSM